MSANFHVRVAKEQLTFSAAHFITLKDGSLCERLHGHNYRVAAEIVGPLDNSQCVIDFIAVRDMLAELTTVWTITYFLPQRACTFASRKRSKLSKRLFKTAVGCSRAAIACYCRSKTPRPRS